MNTCSRNFVQALFSLSVAIAATTLPAYAQSKHQVAPGETLYGLSRRYGVSMDRLREANPGLTAESLKAGMQIAIPTATPAAGTPAAMPAAAGTPAAGRQQMAPDTRQKAEPRKHKVKRKETLYGIARQYGLTVDELLAANPSVDTTRTKLKKGIELTIPEPRRQAAAVAKVRRLTVVLPLLEESVAGRRCIEFYRGMLMAIDQMRDEMQGEMVITTLNEPASGASMSHLMEQVEKSAPDVVIGPLYPGHFETVRGWVAARSKTDWLIPFSSKYPSVASQPRTILLNAPDEYKGQMAADLFVQHFRQARIVFLHEQGGDEVLFTSGLRNRLVAAGMEVADLPVGYTRDDMQKAVAAKGLTLFVPDASTNAVATKLLDQMAHVSAPNAHSRVALAGYSRWNDADSGVRSLLTRPATDVYLCMPYFHDAGSPQGARFTSDYYGWFRQSAAEGGQYAAMGHDAMLAYFGQTQRHQVGTLPVFSRIAEGGGRVNSTFVLLQFTPQGTIQQIALTNR
ncbi:MAG: LysM peptidoglycan-binding domain-containing protein [Alloprevotella sp.]|nr:LysM peptidoglycan-binding domain-containing protein [Alloprevotella sp.]